MLSTKVYSPAIHKFMKQIQKSELILSPAARANFLKFGKTVILRELDENPNYTYGKLHMMIDYPCISNFSLKARGSVAMIKVEHYAKAKFPCDVEIFSERGLIK